jgi:transposase
MTILVRSLRTETGWDQLLATLENSPSLQAFCLAHRNVWRCAEEQVRVLESSLDAQQVALQEDLDRLQTIPGIGRIVGLTVLAVFSDVQRFPSAKHAASYAGLVASTFDSGERVQHGRITCRGSNELRAMLCEAAHHARSANNPFNPYFTKLCARRGYKMAVVAVAHRLCRIAYSLLRRKIEFDLSKLRIEAGRFEQKRVRKYRLKSAAVTA